MAGPNTPVHTADTGNLAKVQDTVIKVGRYTEQHSRPMWGLIEHFKLGKGERQIDIPKYGEMEAHDITPGIELTEGEEIDPDIVSATVNRVALKIIILDDLVDQYKEDIWKPVGRMAGDALGVKEDRDVLAKFAGFSTQLGADNTDLTLQNANGLISYSQSGDTDNDGRRFGSLRDTFIVHHPNAIANLRTSLTHTGATYPIPSLRNWDLLKDYWAGFEISGVQFFSDGNIQKIPGQDSAIGAIFHRSALGVLKGQGRKPERHRNPDLFATQLTWSERYGVFEIDDTKGAGAIYEMGMLSTTN